MKIDQLFAEMPILSIVTNFSTEGEFERVYLVLPSGKEQAQENKRRQAKSRMLTSNTWNGPLWKYRD